MFAPFMLSYPMPVVHSGYFSVTAISVAAAVAATITIWKNQRQTKADTIQPEQPSVQVPGAWRDLLPDDIRTWRQPKNVDDCIKQWDQTWNTLRPILYARGYTLWERLNDTSVASPGFHNEPDRFPELRKSYGFRYVPPQCRDDFSDNSETIKGLCYLGYRNGLCRAASSHSSQDVVIRVIVIKREGQDHLDILRETGTGPNSFYSNNHCLPLLDEIQLEDIVLGVFPRVGQPMSEAFGGWPKNSVGDVLDMIMQMLEALEFIHSLNIAHRDAFQDNFHVQWHPESMLTKKISSTRPRVYLIDFEVAVQFPQEYDESQCFISGLPIGGSFSEPGKYGYCRPQAPECVTGELYSPFKLDIWQLGQNLLYFKSGIASIDIILKEMVQPTSTARPTAGETLNKLRTIVYAMAPESLLIEPLKVLNI